MHIEKNVKIFSAVSLSGRFSSEGYCVSAVNFASSSKLLKRDISVQDRIEAEGDKDAAGERADEGFMLTL
jgi:hypothetical protein